MYCTCTYTRSSWRLELTYTSYMYVDIFPEDRNHSYIHYKYWHLHRAYKLTHLNMSTSHIGICLWPCIGFCTESCNREKYIFLGLLFLGVFNLLVLYVTLRGRTRITATSPNHSNIFKMFEKWVFVFTLPPCMAWARLNLSLFGNPIFKVAIFKTL